MQFPVQGRVAKSGSRDRLLSTPPRHPSTSPALTPRSASASRSRRTASDAQRILHKLRALTTDNRAIPAAARNLLFFFLRPSVHLSLPPLCHPLLPATPPLPSRPHQPSSLPLLFLRVLLVLHVGVLLRVLLLPDFPFFGFRLVRQGASSGTRGRRTFPHASVLRALAVTLLPPLL